MTSRSSPVENPETSGPARGDGAAWLVLVVLLLFSSVVAYFGVAIVGSIVTDLYGAPPTTAPGTLDARERTWCIRALVDLRDELEGKVTLDCTKLE